MQPVNAGRIQQQVIPVQHRTSGQRENAGSAHPGNATRFPDDIVNLSSDPSAQQDSLEKKKPSVPVSPVEMKALRDSFSVYA